MSEVKPSHIDEAFLDRLLGLESSKVGFYRDVKQKIQELEAANLGLRAKKSELQAVFDSIGEALVIYDSNGLVQHRNHVCPRFFPQETLVGKSCRALFHPDRMSAPKTCPVALALEGNSVQLSFSSPRDDGKNRFFDVSSTPIEDPSGQNRALVLIRDITSRRHQEIQLVQSEKMSSVGMLAAGVAHEINNPLTSIAGYAEALVRRFRVDPDLVADRRLEDFPHYLDVIVREAYRCKGIIDSLLSFSRKSVGHSDTVDINHLLGEVVELVCLKARHENIHIEVSLQAGLSLISGDAAELRQVFMNLVINAMQAIGEDGLVNIATGQQGSMVLIQVADSGKGMAPDLIEQIWNPFFTTKGVGVGSGLGLAVSYNIVKAHQGEIEVDSKEGKGSTFTVRLPACQKSY